MYVTNKLKKRENFAMLKIEYEKRNVQELVNMFFNGEVHSSLQAAEVVSYQTAAPNWTSNENSSYMSRYLTKGASVLAVAGSFDHIIDMALYGGRNIYAVDVNPLQFPVDWLKYQAVLNLTPGQFQKFALSTKGNNLLSRETMESILAKAESCPEKEFWERIYKDKDPLDIRLNYLTSERNYIKNRSERIIKFDYPDQSRFSKARKALNESNIFVEEKDIFNVQVSEKSLDLIHLSNLHNFYFPEEYADKIRNLSKFLKEDGCIVLYCIGMKPEWFEAVKKGSERLPLYENDFNMVACSRNPKLMQGMQQQILLTVQLYQELLNDFNVEVIPVRTGRGFAGFNTSTDIVLSVSLKK